MNLTPRPLLEFPSPQIAQILNQSFEGYLVAIQVTAQSFERRFRGESLDAEASKIYYDGETPIGIVLVDRRGFNSRIGAMGIVPAYRDKGVGQHMLREILGTARERGDRGMVLEVFEQNPRAVALYRKMGFEVQRRLLGYQRAAEAGLKAELQEVDILEFAHIVAQEGEANLPWMLRPETLASMTVPVKAWGLEGVAYALVNELPSDAFLLQALVVRRSKRGQGWGRRLVQALAAQYPGKTCRVVQIVPEELAPGFFKQVGFEVERLNQFEMKVKLS